MSLQVVLSNPENSSLGKVTIQLPIPRGQYTECIEKLEALGIGDAVKADCAVERIDGTFPHLGMLEISSVNIEDLNYLAKRLESFSGNEVTQFLAVAYDQELYMTKPLINLTFCCQQVTVITNFNDLEAIGRRHHINLQGSSESNKLETFSDYEAALILINEKSPDAVTPYGVLYENGMRLTEVYDGQYFPCYFYEPNPITVAVISKAEPEDTKHIVWLYLPMEQKEIDRALLHAGITDPSEIRLRLEDSQLPDEVAVRLDKESRKAEEQVTKRREQIEGELPRFVATVEQELGASRDVLTILENYKRHAGADFARELDVLTADMRSSSYEAALVRFEGRLASPMLSDIVRGLIGVLRGDDGRVYFQMLAYSMKQMELQRLKAQAAKIPPKIRVYSFVMLVCFMLIYIVVILMQILTSMGGLFG